jgi:hypothetical protein
MAARINRARLCGMGSSLIGHSASQDASLRALYRSMRALRDSRSNAVLSATPVNSWAMRTRSSYSATVILIESSMHGLWHQMMLMFENALTFQFAAVLTGILRLRNCSALRNSVCAQDDSATDDSARDDRVHDDKATVVGRERRHVRS